MNDTPPAQSKPPGPIPADDPERVLTHLSPETDDSLPHIGVVGDTYTILVRGADTAGRYTLIDMHVPPGGGPPPHRHDFEEMFTILDGECRRRSAASRLPRRARRSTCQRTRRTRSPTPAPRRRGCCVCARRQGRRSSSRWSGARRDPDRARRRPDAEGNGAFREAAHWPRGIVTELLLGARSR